jgi:hypothetical protein
MLGQNAEPYRIAHAPPPGKLPIGLEAFILGFVAMPIVGEVVLKPIDLKFGEPLFRRVRAIFR